MTQTALATTNNGVSAIAKQVGYEESFVQTVKDTIAKGANDMELQLFLQTAKRTGLDPMARQIFAVKRWDSQAQREVMSIQISIDGFRAIADRTNKYVPSREPTFTFIGEKLESATAYIKKHVAGEWHEVAATAFYDEYVQTTKDGKPNRMWQKMPRLMLAKTAESLLLRKAFPAELSGLYTVDEMGTDANEVDAPKGGTVHQMPGKGQLVEAAKQTAPAVNLSPEEQSLRAQLVELCKKAGKSEKAINLSLNKFDNLLKTLEERENYVAEIRAAVETTATDDEREERETLIEAVSVWMTNKHWEEGEQEAFFIEHDIEGGLASAPIEILRQISDEIMSEPIDGEIVP